MDWPPPRFCEVGDEWCQCRRRKAVASRVAGDVARDAARGRRTAGNHFPRGSRFFRGVPEKADRMEPPRTRGNDRGDFDSRRSSAWIAKQGREVAGDGARSPVAVPEASALPRIVPWASSPTRVRVADGIDFTERVRSGYPGSAHRRARTRPSGDVRGETASATTLDARGRRSRGAGFDPRVTPNAMTSPREPLHFSSRSSISTKWIRLSVRALPPRMGIQSRRARFGLPVRARLHSLAPKNANSGAYAQLVSPESKIGSRRISDLLADQ